MVQALVARQALSDEELKKAIDGCDQEPIHIPGSIQPHGFLFALSDDFEILKVSANITDLIEGNTRDLIGQNLSTWITKDKIGELRDIVSEGSLNPIRYTTLELTTKKQETHQFDAVMHRSGEVLILELEKHNPDAKIVHQQDFYQEVMNFSVQLQKVESQTNLYEYLVEEVRKITGFSRVKLYRFDENWNGQIIAESKELHMSSYLGLHFPASDIPKQARQLYSKNYLRLIPDVSFAPVSMMPDDLDSHKKPIDLSFSTLRSVSPVHMEYLKNIGVEASMSISLMQNNKLWGLVACHHHTPYHIPYPVRMATELMAHTFSAFLSNFMTADEESEKSQKESYMRELAVALRPNKSLVETLKKKHTLILQAVNADGVIIHLEGKYFAFGLIPEMSFCHRLIKWLEDNHNEQVFASESISRDTNLAVQGQAMASGVLAIPVSTEMTDYVIWFRQEQTEEVNWAGKPEKNITESETGYHLTPRASFKRWQENIRGYSKRWSDNDIQAANNISKLLLNKKYEDTLKQKGQDLQSILNNSNAFIYIIDTDGKIMTINDAALEAFDLEDRAVAGQHYKDIFHGELAQMMENNHAKVLGQQKSMTFEKDFIFNGKEFHLITVKFPLYDTSGDIYALCSMSTDISKLRATEGELKRSNKELERMAFIASHDLQEPIRMIANFTQLLEKEYAGQLEGRGREYIEFTQNAASRMRDLIHDLLQYSRLNIEDTDIPIIDTQEELNVIIQQAQDMEENQNAEIVVMNDMPKIQMKPEHFNSIMQNLISNALKYRAPERKPKVEVSYSQSDINHEFSVKDNGIGIKKEYFEKIFIIFQRLHKNDEYEGTGVGLALCQRIIDQYNGKAVVQSEVGKGSAFTILIPKNLKQD